MRQDVRAPFMTALQRAMQSGYPPGEYVGQESFMLAGEIRELGRRARIGPGVSVLDVCCGVAGPGRLMVREFGCDYLGIDCSADALAIARELASDLRCSFEQSSVPPLPAAHVDVVVLLETLLAFADKRSLLGEVARVLEPGGRFAFTVEEGRPLSAGERARMPDADTVWPVGLAELIDLLRVAGLQPVWQQDCTAEHLATATALLQAYRADSDASAALIGARASGELIAAHELWCEWLDGGRVRKYAFVAERR